MFYLGDGLDGDYTGYLPYNEFAFLRDDYIREVFSSVDDTNGTYNPTSFVKGYSVHTTFGQLDAPFKNWNLAIKIVYLGENNVWLAVQWQGTYLFKR